MNPGPLRFLALVAAPFALSACEPQPVWRPGNDPEPRDIAALREVNRIAELPPCEVSSVVPASDWIRIAALDTGLVVTLPPDWKAVGVDTVPLLGGFTHALVFRNSSRFHIQIARKPSGSVSRTYRPNIRPSDDCEISGAANGSIWTLYDDPGSDSSASNGYQALGDLVTRGRRYHISLGAASGEERARLVKLVADGAFAQTNLRVTDPVDMNGLRGASNHERLDQCDAPNVQAAADWIYLDGPDAGFKMKLPPDWTIKSRDSISTKSGNVQVVMTDPERRSVMIERVTTRFASRSYLPRYRPTLQCEMSKPRYGTIWTFYSVPVDSVGHLYMGLGDLLTAGGKRYHVSVTAGDSLERNRLARVVADAAYWQ